MAMGLIKMATKILLTSPQARKAAFEIYTKAKPIVKKNSIALKETMKEVSPIIADPPKECPPAPDETQDAAHKQLLSDPVYAVHLHEKQLERHAQLLEEIAVRLISLEKKVLDIEESLHGADPNDPMNNYPEVQMHQNR